MPYRKKESAVWYTHFPTRTGWKFRSTGVKDRATAKAIERMLADLGPKGKRSWDLLEAVLGGQLTMVELYDSYRNNDLDVLRARMKDVDLEAKVADWQEWLQGQVEPDTRRHYLVHIRSLIPEGKPFWRSQLSEEECAKWLNTREVGRSTKRKYMAAANSFFNYLRSVKVIATNPFREVKAPKANKPRVAALDLADVFRVLEASDQDHRGLFAVMYGTGIEVSVALRLTRRDVDVGRREIRAAGTKNHSRDRIVRVAEWAWPYVESLIQAKLPSARLFTLNDRSKVSRTHKATCAGLGLDGFRLHDARHHWAVRAARAGTPPEIIAAQLGHVDATMVLRVYGRFFPGAHDREKWERIASAQDRVAI
jgi:integrase/recombinase XerD